MTADPDKPGYDDDATDEGVSNTDPAEGGDDEPAPGSGSPADVPEGVITGGTADER